MRRLCVALLMVVCSLFFAQNGHSAERWSHFATDEDGVRHFYDVSSVKWVAEDIVQAWDKWELSGEDRGEFRRDMGRDAVSVKSLVEVRCRDREHRSVKIVYQEAEGEEILSFDESAAVWEDIAVGSVTDSLHKALCVYGKIAI